MDEHNVYDYVAGGISLLAGWVMKMLWSTVGHLKSEVGELRTNVNEHFVRKDEFRDAVNDLKASMFEDRRQINAKLEAQSGLLFQVLEKLGNKQDK